jgi:DNA repair exonuclease SbcCD ATPase subunit
MLRNRLLYSLINEFLRVRGLNYTVSVFLPEMAIGEDKLLERNEMIELLGLREVVDKTREKNYSILELTMRKLELTRRVAGHSDRVDRGCQTFGDEFAFDIEKKLDRIGVDYQGRLELDLKNQARMYEEKLTKMKREFEARLKAEVNAEVTRVREFEVSALRLEEAERYRMKMENYRSELEQSYQEKLAKLKDRERDTIEKCKTKMKEIENASHEHRQRILKDLELVKLKEEEVMSKRQLDMESIRMTREKVEEKDKILAEKAKDIEERERRYDNKLKEELEAQRYKLLLEMDSEKITMYSKNKAVEEELKMIPRLREHVDDFSKKNSKISEENNKLREDNIALRGKIKELEHDNQQLRDNLKVITATAERDHAVIKTYEVQIKGLNDQISVLQQYSCDHPRDSECPVL